MDAQGYDLEVIKSAGKYKKIRKIQLEAKAEGVTGFYPGQSAPSEVKAFMEKQGFEHTGTYQSCCQEKLLEVDMMFVNTETEPSSRQGSGANGRPNIMSDQRP